MRIQDIDLNNAFSARVLLDSGMTRLLGKWEVKGERMASSWQLGGPVDAIETFEWMEGKQFLIHRSRGQVDRKVVGYTEFIGADRIYSFDNDGYKRTWASEFNGDTWLITGVSEGHGDRSLMRCITEFVGDAERRSMWERSEDGVTWHTHSIAVSKLVRAAAMSYAA